MASKKISIQLTGRFDDQKNPRADEFLRQLGAVLDILKELDYRFMKKRRASVYYRIVEAYSKSPMTIVLEPVAIDPDVDYGDAIAERFGAHLRSFTKKIMPDDVDYDLREKYLVALENVNGNLTRMRVSVDGEVATITGKVAAFVRPEELADKEAVDTISGKLETIQLHSKREFRIYPVLGAPSILCLFSENLRDAVTGNIDKWVAVTGNVRYKGGSRFPSEMIVTHIRPKKPPEKLPTLADLRGTGEKLSGELTSEEIIRRIRENEW